VNPGSIEEEGGATARTLITGLKESPIVLALVLFNIMFVAAVYYGTRENRSALDRVMTALIEQQAKNAEMLYNCTPNRGAP
jgi:uncharacterized membrane protein affecting hemolysin expression